MNIKFLDRFMTVPLKEKMVFARNLAVMVSSGLTIVRAVYSLSLQTKNATFKKILEDVHDGKDPLGGAREVSERLQ